MTAALALAFGLLVGTWIGAALRGTQNRLLAAQLAESELKVTVLGESSDRLVDDLEHAGRTITHIITGEHTALEPESAA
jgi:hypothetical protein